MAIRSGVSFPSYATTAAYALASGFTADANYPISNLADFTSVRKVVKAPATGTFAVTLTLPAARTIQFLGLIHHNADLASTMRIRMFSSGAPDPTGNAGAIVHDSGVVTIRGDDGSSPVAYPQVRPYLLPSGLSVISVRIDLASNAAIWQLGAVELGGFWEWDDVGVSREIGFDSQDQVYALGKDVDEVTVVWSPRTVKGGRAVITQDEAHTTALDFQREKMMDRQFIWVWDYSDPTTWLRECMAVTNNTLTPPTANAYPSASLAFDFVEFLR